MLDLATLSTFPNFETTTTTALFPTSSTTTKTESVEEDTLLPLGSMTTTVDTTIRFTSTTPNQPFETVDENSPVDPFESDLTTPLVLEGITEGETDPTMTTTTLKFDELDFDAETTTFMTFPPSTPADAVTTLMSFPEMSTTTFNFDASTTSFPIFSTEAKSTINLEASSAPTKSSTTSTEASSTSSTTSMSSTLSTNFSEEQTESNDTVVETDDAEVEIAVEVVVNSTDVDSTTTDSTTPETSSTTITTRTTTTTTVNTDLPATTEIPTTSTLDFDNLALTTTPDFPESTSFPTFSTTPFFPDDLSTTMFSLPATTTEFVLPTTSLDFPASTKPPLLPVQPTVMTTTFPPVTEDFGGNFIQPEVILAESRGKKPQLIALPRDSNGDYVKTSKRHYIIQTPDINTSLYVKFKNLDLPNARDDCSGAKVMAVFGPYTGDTAMPNMPTTMICSDAVLPAFYSNSLHMTIIYPEGPDEDAENTGGMDFELSVVPKSNVEGKDRCNTVMMVGPKKQYIASKDFPNMYPPMSKCAYRIRFDKNNADVLNLHFKAFR